MWLLGADDDGEEGEAEEAGPSKELTLEGLAALERSAFKAGSLKGLRKVVLAFKCASMVADERRAGGGGGLPYAIASSAVFDKLLVSCLTSLPGAFAQQLLGHKDFDPSDPAPFSKLPSLPAFGALKPISYRALKALSFLMGQITDPGLLHFVLMRLERFVPFLIPFPRQAKRYLKILVGLWATNDAVQVRGPPAHRSTPHTTRPAP
jgi:hypothetical protein